MKKIDIPFNIPPVLGVELEYLNQVLINKKICGDGPFTYKCRDWFIKELGVPSALLTTSCTSALEMCAVLLDLEEGDEIIMPSYTFVSSALAFVMNGAKIVFVDIDPKTMNIDPDCIEAAITPKTKAIVAVHYAGVSCDMNRILDIGAKYNLRIIEDAAQGMMSKYNGKHLGSIGDLGSYSFHETKNFTCGEGGLLLINNKKFTERAEILREKGTNRSKFFRGQVDKYTWVDKGSSWLPSELNAAYLYSQLENSEIINTNRLNSWNLYYSLLLDLQNKGFITLPFIPDNCIHNAHMFYIKVKNLDERTNLTEYLLNKGIQTVFHYIPLHSSPGGIKYGRFHGDDIFTTIESERLLRLPMFYGLTQDQIQYICKSIEDFFL
ncbi:MAG: dTDP-4-amino-4,6-dideoxygalactose transaminase [Spirochaetales bacterium]|nr:dTDP-4-amino-4,6-dideoxygalactose transaminase [Spirochaetales bacterium]